MGDAGRAGEDPARRGGDNPAGRAGEDPAGLGPIGQAALVVARLRAVVDRADAAIAHVANDVPARPDLQGGPGARNAVGGGGGDGAGGGAGDAVAVAALNAAVGDAENAALQLIGQLREMVAVLVREREQLRIQVEEHGLLDPPQNEENDDLEEFELFLEIDENALQQPRFTPRSLLHITVSTVVDNFSKVRQEMRFMPTNLLFAIYENMHERERLCQLGYEWCNLDIFQRMLIHKSKRVEIHRIYEALVRAGTAMSGTLLAVARQRVDWLLSDPSWTHAEVEFLYDFVLELGIFFLESCSFTWAGEALNYCQTLLRKVPMRTAWRQLKLFELNYWLLEYYTGNCLYADALNICGHFDSLLAHAERFDDAEFRDNAAVNFAQILIQGAVLRYQMGEYRCALRYAAKALRSIVTRKTPMKTIIDVLRHTAKILICLREFSVASRLVEHAVFLTLKHFDGGRRFTCVLFDYAFCLINEDHIEHALDVYAIALQMREDQFGQFSVRTSQALEDVAYALYVHEYGTGNFQKASEFASRAVEINKRLLPEDHMLIASSQRMKALIMEEQALDLDDEAQKRTMLDEALELHTAALNHYRRRFGEENIHTAKNYGNIGRLYQSMGLFEKSEEMHRKAIEIKARVLGEEDYETALSMGHLAALYTHDMNRQEDARDLYLKSVQIALKMFGDSFTGLEYDYRGLLRVYRELGDTEQANVYRMKLLDWEQARNRSLAEAPTDVWGCIPAECSETSEDVARECLARLLTAGLVCESQIGNPLKRVRCPSEVVCTQHSVTVISQRCEGTPPLAALGTISKEGFRSSDDTCPAVVPLLKFEQKKYV